MAVVNLTGISQSSSSGVGTIVRIVKGLGGSDGVSLLNPVEIRVVVRLTGSAYSNSTILANGIYRILRVTSRSLGKSVLPAIRMKKYSLFSGTVTGKANAEAFISDKDIFNNMIKKLPSIFKEDAILKELLKMFAVEATILAATIKWISDQKSVDLASEVGLKRFEKELRIIPDANSTVDERRLIIKDRLKRPDILTKKRYTEIMNTFYDMTVDELTDVQRVVSTIWSVRGIPKNIKDIKQTAEKVLPAHLEYEIVPTWLTWGEIEDYGLTGEEAETYTTEELSEAFLFPYEKNM
ncbi:putative phage tail protein [Paenibacillus sp. Marseille-Q4541]|uniref:putative phage tail protein n=1 Tax=Paenibacillus sp. Marseille-Q4541 TaxID=2831522 RepID=UPI001BA5E22E|nr:putative phage tail protein [Paenibacillus sp. Marseille-Q4541]